MKTLAARAAFFVAVIAADATGARAAPATYNWTGCYVGINGGYGWDNGRSSYQNDPNFPNPDIINNLPDPFGLGTYAYIAVPAKTGGSGGLAGFTAGCNVQNQKLVWGLEADFDWAHISSSATNVANSGAAIYETQPGGGGTSLFDTATANEQVSLRWLSTIRARIGFAIKDRVLLYATGGVAIGHVDTQGSITTFSPFPLFINPGWAGTNSTTKSGGVIGGGVEWAFADHWSAKAEYLWYDLGHGSHPLTCSFPSAAICAFDTLYPTLGNTVSSVYGSVLRVGLNYKFSQ